MRDELLIKGKWNHVALLQEDGLWSVVHAVALTTYGPQALKAVGCKSASATRLTLPQAEVVADELDRQLGAEAVALVTQEPEALPPPTREELQQQAAKAKKKTAKLKQGGLW